MALLGIGTMPIETDAHNAFLVEALLDFLRKMYPDASFMIVPDKTTQLNVPVLLRYDPWLKEFYEFDRPLSEPDFQIEHIQIRQSAEALSLWWGYGEKTNRLAYWVEDYAK